MSQTKAERFAKLNISEHDQSLFDSFREMATGQVVRNGYHFFLIKDHPSANNHGYVKTSIMMAEAALGKKLPKGAIVHHVNGDTMDNRGCNLVICQNISYHRLLHTRINAFNATGNADHRKCFICHTYDDVINMNAIRVNDGGHYHKKCRNKEYYAMVRERRNV